MLLKYVNKKEQVILAITYHKLNVFTFFINVLQCFLCCNEKMTESISLTLIVINKYDLLIVYGYHIDQWLASWITTSDVNGLNLNKVKTIS
jgi:hypothetical protein